MSTFNSNVYDILQVTEPSASISYSVYVVFFGAIRAQVTSKRMAGCEIFEKRSRHKGRFSQVLEGLEELGVCEPQLMCIENRIPSLLATYVTGSVETRWLDKAKAMEAEGRVHAALDLVYEKIDTWLNDGKFSSVDWLLESVPTTALSVNLIVGILTVTRLAASKLQHRAAFAQEATEYLWQQRLDVKALLHGLTEDQHLCACKTSL